MKRYYEVNYNGEKLNFNHHEEVFEQIKEYYKYSLLYTWAEKWEETFIIGETEILVTDLIESWTGYPQNGMGKALYKRLANSVFENTFADDIRRLIEYDGERVTGVDFPKFDFSILKKEGEV